MSFRFLHSCVVVSDVEKSIAFYKEALGLSVKRRIDRPELTLVYLGDDSGSEHELELNYKPGNSSIAGSMATHIAFTADDFAAAKAKHEAMGCIQLEIPEAGIYFISDPDKHMVEILPENHPAARK